MIDLTNMCRLHCTQVLIIMIIIYTLGIGPTYRIIIVHNNKIYNIKINKFDRIKLALLLLN